MFESRAENEYAFVLDNDYSRYTIITATPKRSAQTVAKVLLERLILFHGHPGTLLVSDRRGEIMTELRLSDALSIKTTFTTPYHPESDGVVERFNRTLLRLLMVYVSETQEAWDQILP